MRQVRRPQPGRGLGPDEDVVEGPVDDPRSVLAERLIEDRSVLDDIEVVYEPERPAMDDDLAALLDDEAAAEHTAEAEWLIHGDAAEDDSLTPEGLEDVLEPFPVPTDETLHEVEWVNEALLDEGTELEADDDEVFEAEIAGGGWLDEDEEG